MSCRGGALPRLPPDHGLRLISAESREHRHSTLHVLLDRNRAASKSALAPAGSSSESAVSPPGRSSSAFQYQESRRPALAAALCPQLRGLRLPLRTPAIPPVLAEEPPVPCEPPRDHPRLKS